MILMQGARGKDVLELQRQLIASGADIEADGKFGPKTARAVREFQKAAGIRPDGIVGNDTRNAFNMPPIPRARPNDEMMADPAANVSLEAEMDEPKESVPSSPSAQMLGQSDEYWNDILAAGEDPMLRDHIAAQQQADLLKQQEALRQAQPATVQQRMNARMPDANGMQQRFDKYLENKRMGR